MTPDHIVMAYGEDAAVCNAVVGAHREAGSGTAAPIASRPARPENPGTRWLVCEGEPGSGIGLISARSVDQGRWITRKLPIREPYHAGDTVRAHIEDEMRAWVTYDSLVGEQHKHVWTGDGGSTWLTTFPPGS